MLTTPLSLPGRLAALALICVLCIALGAVGGASWVHQQSADDRLQAAAQVSTQAIRAAHIEAAQDTINLEVSHDTESRIAAVHRHYAERLRQPAPVRPSPMSQASGAPGGADAALADSGPVAPSGGGGLHAESYDALAERCAVTTVIALGWQQREAALQAVDVVE